MLTILIVKFLNTKGALILVSYEFLFKLDPEDRITDGRKITLTHNSENRCLIIFNDELSLASLQHCYEGGRTLTFIDEEGLKNFVTISDDGDWLYLPHNINMFFLEVKKGESIKEVGEKISDEYLKVLKKIGHEYTGEKGSPLVRVSLKSELSWSE